MATGKFITFEGGEGAGKSTQVGLLAVRLRAAGIDVVMTREPGGSPFGERLRDLVLDPATPEHSALSEALLFFAARADHLETTIRPALAEGRWVICDRFSDSTRAYQGSAGAVAPEIIDALDQLVVAETQPDLTVISLRAGFKLSTSRCGAGFWKSPNATPSAVMSLMGTIPLRRSVQKFGTWCPPVSLARSAHDGPLGD